MSSSLYTVASALPAYQLIVGRIYLLRTSNEEVIFVASTSDPCWAIVETPSGQRFRVDRAELIDAIARREGSGP